MNIVGILYNLQLLKYAGEDGIAAYGVMMYIGFVFAAAFIGYSIGTAPLFGYHDGAGNHAELKSLLRKSLILVGIFAGLMVIVAEVLALPLSKIFVSYDSKLLELTVSGLRIYALSFPFMGYAIFSSGLFTALNDGVTSAIISFLRTLVFQLGAVLLMPKLWGGLDGIWWSVVAADFIAVAISAAFLVAKRKKFHY